MPNDLRLNLQAARRRARIVPSRNPAPSRPRPLRQPRLLIVGCGDVGLRTAALLRDRCRLRALSSSPARFDLLRQQGITPIAGNLDQRTSLRRLHGLAPWVLHLAPPPAQGPRDPRTSRLLSVLGPGLRRLIYASTTGVYGDAGGTRFDETRPVNPATPRATRRVNAEQQLRRHGQQAGGPSISLLRIPGIYALDREGGDPRERVRRGAPVLCEAEDVYTNHIHADDLARAIVAALWRARPQRVYHVNDATELKMGDYFDRVADLCGLPRPPRLDRSGIAATVGALTLSFMSESRRLIARRLHDELRLTLHYPTLETGISAAPVRSDRADRRNAPQRPSAATESSPAAPAPRS
jgi:nucleoside-diphosphate-sugar epimerase